MQKSSILTVLQSGPRQCHIFLAPVKEQNVDETTLVATATQVSIYDRQWFQLELDNGPIESSKSP